MRTRPEASSFKTNHVVRVVRVVQVVIIRSKSNNESLEVYISDFTPRLTAVVLDGFLLRAISEPDLVLPLIVNVVHSIKVVQLVHVFQVVQMVEVVQGFRVVRGGIGVVYLVREVQVVQVVKVCQCGTGGPGGPVGPGQVVKMVCLDDIYMV